MNREKAQSEVFDLRKAGFGFEGIQEYLATQYDVHYSVFYIKKLLTQAIHKERMGSWKTRSTQN